MKKFLAFVMMIITLWSFAGNAVFAAEPPFASPYLNNGINATTNFTISSSGRATVQVEYSGIKGTTTKVTSTIYLQKKILGLFWTTVDIGTTNDQWVDSSTRYEGYFIHSFQLESTGTYRAVFKVVFSGSGGADDVIEDKIEKKYS